MSEIDPIGGFRVVRPDPVSSKDWVRRRSRKNARTFGFLAFGVAVLLCTPVIAFMV